MRRNDGGIEAYSGRYLYPLNPKSSDVDIEDVAHALGNKCRYTGHTREFYSVAQHSVIVSELVPRELALGGLLHDASEYLLPDVSSPVKPRLKGFKEIEESVLDAVWKRFGIQEWRSDDELMATIKKADIAAMAIEVHHLMHKDSEYWSWLPPADIYYQFSAWDPETSKERFLERYHQIVAGQPELLSLERRMARGRH